MARLRIESLFCSVFLLVFCLANEPATTVLPVAAQTGSNTTAVNVDPGMRFTYDANGNVLTRTDAADNVTTYEYDANNRLTTIRYPDNTSVTYRYDSLVPQLSNFEG